ncbi:MAG: hypothetical protein AABO58_17350 [Acidobacteriota bacterium]
MKSRFLIAIFALFASVEAFGANVQADEASFEAPVDLAGSVWLNNPYGSIDVVGGEGNKIVVTVQRIINAMNEQALKDAREIVNTTLEGDARVRVVKTNFPERRDARWTAIVNYNVRVPRSVHVKIVGRAMDHIRVSQLLGNLSINAVSGTIMLSNLGGASLVETINGRVIYDYPDRPLANARVQAINADIDIYAPRESMFDWVAETLNGDLLTTFDIRGLFSGNVYRGRTANSGGPTLTTSTLSGRVMLLVRGTSPQQARRVTRQTVNTPQGGGASGLAPVRRVQIPFIYLMHWEFAADVADVSVGEIHGSTRIQTGAGEVQLGVVYGAAVVNSRGGPLNFGDMMGPLDVHTDAGDVTIRVSRQGGSASTEGGSVRVTYAGGPMNLRSGGGDIVVQQANAPIDASTLSGDISLTLSPLLKTQRVSAKTAQGNVTLVVNPNFAADIDAVVITNDGDANRIHSDFNLTFRREAYKNGKTRIRATGKINGGGERIELVAEDGSINISSQVVSPMVIANPRR